MRSHGITRLVARSAPLEAIENELLDPHRRTVAPAKVFRQMPRGLVLNARASNRVEPRHIMPKQRTLEYVSRLTQRTFRENNRARAETGTY